MARPARLGIDEDYAATAFLATRARFHLSYRLVVRFWQLTAPDGGAQSAPWRVALLVFVAIDVALWAVLRRPERFGIKARLVVDSVDIAIWSLAPYPPGMPFTPAVWIGVPLAIDAGFRNRWGGLAVVLGPVLATSTTRSIAGRALEPLTFLWLVLGVGCGVLIARYIRHLQERTDADWDQIQSAEHQRSYLAGQNAVAMGASSVVDAIEGVLPVLGPPSPGSALWGFASDWKPELHRSTRDHAVYLGQVLAEWAAEYNRHPDLSSRVELSCPEGIGTNLLTYPQNEALRRLLTELDLRGHHRVTLQDPSIAQRPPGGPIELWIGNRPIKLAADPKGRPKPYDPGPAVFVIASFLMLSDAVAMPIRPVALLLGAALSLGAAAWSHLKLSRLGSSARPMIMVAAVGVAFAYSAIATANLVEPANEAGAEIYPVSAGLSLIGLLGGMYWSGLSSRDRGLMAAGVTAIAATSWSLHPLAHHPLHLALGAVWSLPLFVSGVRFAKEVVVASAQYSQTLLSRDEGDRAQVFEQGRASVIDLVSSARNEAHERLAIVRTSLSPDLAENVQDRLEEVDRRLAKLTHPDGSSS